MDGNGGAASRMRRRLSGLSGPALAGLLAAGLVVLVGTAVAGYRTYDWIEHDNEFCLSCHLMADPYERFAESAHRDLGCKECHKPTLVARSQMAMTQVLENPDSLEAHAEVPNDKCEGCHVDAGDERWEDIANTAGHRVHFESDDPALDELACVQCHSTTVHGFAATDQTCAQSGCHTDVDIRLGSMSDLTIHCASCHQFNAPVEAATAVTPAVALGDDALRPSQSECLGCHQMQVLVDMPDDEPHEASCGTCHNPHDQDTPAEAVQTCATAQCHADPVGLTPHHVGLAESTVADCSSCHTAHVFRVDGDDCAACHQDIDAPVRADPSALDHDQHADVACSSCHEVSTSHGAAVVEAPADCLACHHTEPLAADCTTCHDAADTPAAVLPVTRPWTPSVGPAGTRTMDFEHGSHADVECATCHTDGPTLSAEAVSCVGCHEEHHEPEVRCVSCHEAPPSDAHTVASHLECVSCHVEAPARVAEVPRTRAFCVSCHVDLEDHRPEGNCADCHALPDPVGGGG